MKFISYAQNFEDVMLWRALKTVENGFYIDIGAAWPEQDSVTKAFYDRGWHGINIEPNPAFHTLLDKYRERDINLQVAVGDCETTVTLNIIYDTGLSTIDPVIADSHLKLGWKEVEQQVQMTTLEHIWQQYVPDGQPVHFLKIDVEGLEKAVIQGADWKIHRPWLVVVEATQPLSSQESHAKWEPFLSKHSYRMIYADGLNRFYLAEEKSELSRHFKYPPNVFDEYILFGSVKEKNELQVLNKKIAKLEYDAVQSLVELESYKSELQGIMQSLSWRMTFPLRHLNLTRIAKICINKTNRLKRRVCDRVNGRRNTKDFIEINFKNFKLKFSAGPLTDVRGIGRVAREHLKLLKMIAEESNSKNTSVDTKKKIIHFYSSIHWCPKRLPNSSVVMIHDVIPLQFPDNFPDTVVHEWRTRFMSVARQADHIVTISKSSSEAIQSFMKIREEKISVVHNGVTPLATDNLVDISLPTEAFFVYLGAYDHHKNLDIVLHAMVKDCAKNIHLVMIGDNEKCFSIVQALGLSARVHFMGKRSDSEVGYILKKSCGLVFPSLYEGFGLPPLEAALLGVPSVCSNRPAMSELLEEGLFCDPHDSDAWAVALNNLADNPDYRSTVLAKISTKVANFTWDKSAQKLYEVFVNLQ